MGSPLRLNNTVTTGVVSCINRRLNVKGVRSDIEYIQTDAVTNNDTSGGPLVDLNGEVIGVISRRANEAGVSYAIPNGVINDFLENPSNSSGYLSLKAYSLFCKLTGKFTIVLNGVTKI